MLLTVYYFRKCAAANSNSASAAVTDCDFQTFPVISLIHRASYWGIFFDPSYRQIVFRSLETSPAATFLQGDDSSGTMEALREAVRRAAEDITVGVPRYFLKRLSYCWKYYVITRNPFCVSNSSKYVKTPPRRPHIDWR